MPKNLHIIIEARWCNYSIEVNTRASSDLILATASMRDNTTAGNILLAYRPLHHITMLTTKTDNYSLKGK